MLQLGGELIIKESVRDALIFLLLLFLLVSGTLGALFLEVGLVLLLLELLLIQFLQRLKGRTPPDRGVAQAAPCDRAAALPSP